MLEIYMPFYGRFDHLRAAVDSVRNQRDPRWRLTVVDDVYPDLEPGLWVESISDDRITYLRNTENLRPSGNYNACVSMSDADHLVLMGCDDELEPEYVGRVLELLADDPSVDLIQPGVRVIDEHGHPSDPLADRVKRRLALAPGLHGGEGAAVSLLRGNWTYFPSLVWKRSWLTGDGFRRDLDVVQDLAMIMSILQSGGRLLVDDQIVFRYRRHSRSVSAVTGPDATKFRQERQLFDELAVAMKERGWERGAREARRHPTSRLNALSEIPRAIRAKDGGAINRLLRHAVT